MVDLEGVILSDYLLLRCISKGNVADVYHAQLRGEGNYEVAVKVFHPDYARHATLREHFMVEAEKIGQFDHANILPLLEFGEGEDLLYTVTPFVSSGTLLDLLKRRGGKLTPLEAVPMVQQLCDALQYAHDRGIIHGNIKPTNIFVRVDGRMLLADFGMARVYAGNQQARAGLGWSSVEYAEYMAPEEFLGMLRTASDIYSLGAVLFLILTGQPPFTGQSPDELLLKHVRQQPPSARLLAPGISDAVDGVLQRALQKDSAERYGSAQELSSAFVAAVAAAPVASAVATKPVPPEIASTPGSFVAPASPGLKKDPVSDRALALREQLRKILPVLVVILLLLGLLGALLSSFFFPGG